MDDLRFFVLLTVFQSAISIFVVVFVDKDASVRI